MCLCLHKQQLSVTFLKILTDGLPVSTKPKRSRWWAPLLTNLVVHFECDVKLEDDQHELEPSAHLFVGSRDVDCKHNIIGLDPLHCGLLKIPDLVALVGTPGGEPFIVLLVVMDDINTLRSYVRDSGGWAWCCRKNKKNIYIHYLNGVTA